MTETRHITVCCAQVSSSMESLDKADFRFGIGRSPLATAASQTPVPSITCEPNGLRNADLKLIVAVGPPWRSCRLKEISSRNWLPCQPSNRRRHS